ncbi:DUF4397 domain-containing protein [Hufsiella ginkgonis]|uniref:DUF4397 domain-containing protein n=1 Tax=Hufsiella ginkgonis TaxID=2695274 RepID=A0A7K1XYL4_9SPHI|nr:DUF4397 domain-containing protein [Hufsiella ginkgonis]MXV16085.1 DUF4397 domain-containing protein [Hufsiella ginkgonis]
MKINLPAVKSRALAMVLMLAGTASLLISACVKSSDEQPMLYTALQVVNASPGLPAIDLFFNNNRVNGDREINYKDTISYKSFIQQTANIVIKKHFSSTAYINQNITFDGAKYYTLFLIGKPDSLTYVITEDNTTIPDAGNARVRFLHLAHDTPALEMRLGANKLFSGAAYKSASPYSLVVPGTYTLGLYKSGTDQLLSQQSVTIKDKKIYTIYAAGYTTNAVDSLKMSAKVLEY